MIKKTICKGLHLVKTEDGHWLSFDSSDNFRGIINIENYEGIVGKAMLGWAKDILKPNHTYESEVCINCGHSKKYAEHFSVKCFYNEGISR
jgi:hypothetical protein